MFSVITNDFIGTIASLMTFQLSAPFPSPADDVILLTFIVLQIVVRYIKQNRLIFCTKVCHTSSIIYEIRMEQMHQEKNCGYILETLRRIQQKIFFESFVLNIYLCLLDKLRAKGIGMVQLFFSAKRKLTERLSYYTQTRF